ncbi:UpxY family transcription antiterminator [Bacteroides sp.]
MVEKQKYWYAARVRDKQEFAIRDFLQQLKAELDIEYYLPTQFVIRQLKYRRKQVEVPVIKNVIFVRATKQAACDIPNKYNVSLYYMRDLSTKGLLVVPDKQMEDFMFVMNLDPESVSFDNASLAVGNKVQVVKGEFCGIEGELATIANRTHVVIRINGVLSASIKVPKAYLKVIS